MELDELDELHAGVSHSLSKDRNLEGTLPLEPTRESAARQRVATAMRMGSLATAAHHAAGDLEEQFPQAACYVRDAASGFERISNLLRDPNLDKILIQFFSAQTGHCCGSVTGGKPASASQAIEPGTEPGEFQRF